jgi:hypothetical protein
MDFTWVTTDDANAIQNSIVDAKGDLISATANDTPARLAVGANGETLVADSSTSTGLRYQPTQAAGKNIIINGGFDIWQRGTSSAGTGYVTADRWNFDSANATKSQQTTGAPSGSRYILRNAFTSASGAYSTAIQYIETAQVAQVWGQTITVSVKLRRSSGMASNLSFFMQKNATADAGPPNGGWTTVSTTTVTNASMPTGTGVTDWFTATITTTIPNDGTANSIRVLVATSTEPGNSSYWEMAQCQLEIGSVATQFTRAGGTIQGELAACQRYYYRQTSSSYTAFGSGNAGSTTLVKAFCQLPVSMRVKPSAVDFSTLALYDNATIVTGVTTLAIDANLSSPNVVNVDVTGATGLTQYRNYWLVANASTSGYVGFSAEL